MTSALPAAASAAPTTAPSSRCWLPRWRWRRARPRCWRYSWRPACAPSCACTWRVRLLRTCTGRARVQPATPAAHVVERVSVAGRARHGAEGRGTGTGAAAPPGGGALGAARAPALRAAWAALLAGAAGAGGAVAELLAFHARLACLGLSTYEYVLRQRAAAAGAAARAGAPERALSSWGGAAPAVVPCWSRNPCGRGLLRGGGREDPGSLQGRAWGVGRALGAALATARSSCSM